MNNPNFKLLWTYQLGGKMTKPVFPKNLLSTTINNENEAWLQVYKNERTFAKGYFPKLVRFFHYKEFAKIPFNQFTNKEIESFITALENNNFSTDTINAQINQISGFKKYLIEKFPEKFPKDFLDDLPRFDKTSESDAIILNLKQLNLIREFNSRKIIYEYIFEMYFQNNIMKKEIYYCLPEFSNPTEFCFTFTDSFKLKYNRFVAELLEKVQKNNGIKFTDSTITEYFKSVGVFLRKQKPSAFIKTRPLNYSDIEKSRERYMVLCPNCHRLTENNSHNWVLVKYEGEKNYRLVCSVCKGEPYDN
jgi:hypothetical protein